MDYDVLVLGGGIVGCTVAYELSKYNLNIAVIEREYDIADDISFINTAIVYDGSETTNDSIAELEYEGNKLIEESCKKFGIWFKKVGALRIADKDNEIEKLNLLYNQAKRRKTEGVYLIDGIDAKDIEPNIDVNIKKALYTENVHVTAPYDLAIAYGEVAADNGVNFRLEEEVIDIQSISKGFRVTTNKNKFSCRIVINTIPHEINVDDNVIIEEKSMELNQKIMQYLLLENEGNKVNSKIIIKAPDENRFVVKIPTMGNEELIGIKQSESMKVRDSVELVNGVLPNISINKVTDVYEEAYDRDEIFIDDTNLDNGYISVTGKHYGKITIAPAIAQRICKRLKQKFNYTEKKNFIDRRREIYKLKDISKEELNDIVKLDKRYGKIICVCNKVSEGEIVECIRRPLGARTVKGVMKRTGAGFGNCHGSYCIRKIIAILAREMDKKPSEIVIDSKNSRILTSRIKEFDNV